MQEVIPDAPMTSSAGTCLGVCAPIGAQDRTSTSMRRFGQPENDGNAKARGIVAGETRAAVLITESAAAAQRTLHV
jgi:hypothetical protein